MELALRGETLTLPGRLPLVMGIVNATPDSVSDAGHVSGAGALVDRGLALVRDGADLVDVGGQSGRTDRPAVGAAAEIARVEEAVTRLAAAGVRVSIDTALPEVAEAAVAAGAVLVNDVSGLRDRRMAEVAAQTGAGLVILHTRAAPQEEHFPGYADVVGDVSRFFRERIDLAERCGVRREQLVLDPGPDYAKTPEETIQVLRRFKEFACFSRPLLLAVSRKYFIGMATNRPPDQRLPGTLAAIKWGIDAGAGILRVHDVAEVVEFAEVDALLTRNGSPALKGDAADESLKWLPPGSG